MMRKIFLTPKDDIGDRRLCTTIFHLAHTISGKVCQLTIDLSCCKNMILEVVASNLKLELKEYPTPYIMSWLKRGTEVTISK